MANHFGAPHYELVSKYGYRESLIGTYATKAEAQEYMQLYKSFGADCYPGLAIRYCSL